MYKEVEVDVNLYHLENILFDLDKYNFDNDITSMLNALKCLVDKKIWSNYEDEDTYIIGEKIKIQLFKEKQ